MATLGRPRMYKTPEELQTVIEEYFISCHPTQVKNDKNELVFNKHGAPYLEDNPPTVSGLALYLGFCDRVSMYNYKDNPVFSNTIKTAISRISEYAEKKLYSDRPVGAIYWLKNHGWIVGEMYNNPPPQKNQPETKPKKLTRLEFIEKNNYPSPYPKQIEMMDFVNQSGVGQLLGARNYGKTDYGLILNLAYELYLDNDLDVLIITKEEDRGKTIVSEISRCLRNVGIEFDVDNSKEFNIAGHIGKDYSLTALPLRSKSFRGRHPKRIICDDIITPDDCSEAERKRVKLVWNEILKLTPNICVIGQPAHSKDIYADLRAETGVRKMEVPYGSIPELDCDLEAQRAAGVSEDSIQASYFLKISESEQAPFSNIERVNFFPAGSSAGFIDPSSTGGDYTAFVVGAMNFDNLILSGFAFKKSWDYCFDEIQNIVKAYNMQKGGFETNGLGKLPVRLLQEKGLPFIGWTSTDCLSGKGARQGKYGRILNAAMFKKHMKLSTFIPDSIKSQELINANKEFNKLIIDFDHTSKHDDAPDAVASLLMYIGVLKR